MRSTRSISKDASIRIRRTASSLSRIPTGHRARFSSRPGCRSDPSVIRGTRDNGAMPIVPTGFVHQGHLDDAIKIAIGSLGPEVTHVAYRIGPDSTDVPSIFFRILL